MRLLFDQNISHRILDLIVNDFPESAHIKDFGLHDKGDKEIWNYAKENNFTLVTFDSDFNDFSTLFGSPPKIIWLRLRNSSTSNVANVLLNKADAIKSFINSYNTEANSVLEIYNL